jgi:hypothetical protein
MPLSDFAQDEFVGPFISRFTTANIADMSRCDSEQENWLDNFILNTLAGARPPHPDRQYMFNYLRRTEASFREYSLARQATLEFLGGRSPSRYLRAISHWEDFLSHSYIAIDLLREFAKVDKRGLFTKGDGSTLDRLNYLYNLTKHAGAVDFPTDSTLAIWLENDGLRSQRQPLSFIEISDEILPLLAKWASIMQDPRTLKDKVKQAQGGTTTTP